MLSFDVWTSTAEMLKESLRFRNSSTNRFPVSVTRTQTHTQGFLSLACNYGWRRVETGRKSNLNFLTESGPPQRHSMASYLFVSHPHALPVSYRWCDVAPHTGWCAGVLASLSISCCGHSSFLLHLRHKMRVSSSAHLCFNIAFGVFNSFHPLAFSTQTYE